MDKVLFQFKVQNFKNKAKKKAKAAWDWCVEHPQIAIAGATAAVGGAKFLIKEGNKIRRDHHERIMADEYYDRRIYDPSDGIKYTLKHSMSDKEKSEYGRLRHEEGLSVWEALKRMKLID